MLTRVAVALCAVGLLGCAAAGGSTGNSGGGPSVSRRDERQFIGSFADVRAVAVSRRFMYAATPSGIAVYDRLFNAWQTPLTRDNGFIDNQVTVIAGDPVEDAVWYGVPGAIVSYRPQVEQMQRTPLPGVPDLIAFDRSPAGDLMVRSNGQWTRVSRTGLATAAPPPSAASVVVPGSLGDLYVQFPALRSSPQLFFREQQADRALRSFAVISGAASPDRASEVWLGTSGDGVYKVDPNFQQATALRYGPLESAIGALALAADGVWAAGLGTNPRRAGLSFSSNSLQQWRWIDGTIAVPMLGMRAQAMAVRGQRAWIGTDRGLVRVQLDGTQAITAWTTLDGLPDDRVYAVAPDNDGAWIGTARGLVWVSDSGETRDRRTRGIGAQLLANTPVYALQAVGDTLWIGTGAGLLAMPGRAGRGAASVADLARPVGADPALRRPIRALAWSDSVLLAATDDGVLRLTPRRPSEPVRVPELDVRLVGQVTRLAMDDRTVWLAGTDGLLVQSRGDAAPRVLRAPGDLPGPVTDLVASRDWLWVATPAGILRLHRRADGGLP